MLFDLKRLHHHVAVSAEAWRGRPPVAYAWPWSDHSGIEATN